MNKVEHLFLKSLMKSSKTTDVIKWLKEQNEKVSVNIERVAFKDLKKWRFDHELEALRHESKLFFSIEGIRVTTNKGPITTWDQPIINQPEIGYLGFITKMIDGVLYFLLQAKIEPGNINCVQLSPTIQATRSNYNQVHKGNKPMYLEYFVNVSSKNILLDQLQSEQGARFLMKRNRNIIIIVEEDFTVHENFIWLTLGEIKDLMKLDNLINMDTRTVLSGIKYGTFNLDEVDLIHNSMSNKKNKSYELFKSFVTDKKALNTIDEIIHFITNIKSKYDLFVSRISLNKTKNWNIHDDEISRNDGKFFKVIGVDVSISNREVLNWQQPMIQPSHEGIIGFICKSINGVLHFLVQAKLECGNKDIIEMAPTVQCLTGDYRSTDSLPVDFLDYILNAKPNQILIDTFQSEEGGRFFKEQNRNIIVVAENDFSEKLPEQFIWMTLHQLNYFNRFNNYLNIQARSLISMISF